MESTKQSGDVGTKFVLPPHLVPGGLVSGATKPKKDQSSPVSVVATLPETVVAFNIPADAGFDRGFVRDAVKPFALDNAQPLDPKSFPNQSRNPGAQILPTIANLSHLLKEYGIYVKYNVVKKKLQITLQGHSGSFDNHDNVVLTQIMSLASLNGFPLSQIPSLLTAVGDRNLYNPVASWINSLPWDRVDRLQSFFDTLVERPDFPKTLKEQLMRRWVLSAVAAAMKASGFRCRGVLTLQGPQSIGKTTWVSALVPDEVLRANVVLLNHHLDGSNKDSITTAVSHWVVEIGELDGSFKKDIARLKGFLTAESDKVRRPYGRLDSEYPRRTVFCATVNDSNFLVDQTGNSRWWTIPVTQINFAHGIDMQQLFAQIAVLFHGGEQWWLTLEEERTLELHNKAHRLVSALNERILDAVDLERSNDGLLPALTAIEVLRALGLNFPSNAQCKECASILREHFGESKRINGRDKWRVPLKNRQSTSIGPVTPPGEEY